MKFKDGKDGYCDTTLSKRMGKASHGELVKRSKADHQLKLEKIRKDYDAGNLRVPCVVLQCIAYDEQLVTDLVQEKMGVKKAQPIDVSEDSPSVGRRKRKTRDASDSASAPSSSPQKPRLT